AKLQLWYQMASISQKWRLDGLLLGKSPDDFCRSWLQSLSKLCRELETASDLAKSVRERQTLSADFRQFTSYAHCLFSEHVSNVFAQAINNGALELETLFQKASSQLDHKLAKVQNFEDLLTSAEMQAIAFSLERRRVEVTQKMAIENEAIASDLAIHGYHGWYELYKEAISQIEI